MDLMDRAEEGFYPIKIFMWQNKGNTEGKVWWSGLELSNKLLLNHSKSMKELNWTLRIYDNNFLAWYKSQSLSFQTKCVLIHNNSPSHVSKLIREFFQLKDSQERRKWNNHHHILIWIRSKMYSLFIWVLWRINLRRLFNAKSIFILINCCIVSCKNESIRSW